MLVLTSSFAQKINVWGHKVNLLKSEREREQETERERERKRERQKERERET